MLTRNSELTDQAQTWIHGSARVLSEEEASTLLAAVREFIADWKSHGKPVAASCTIVDSRFLTTSAECPGGLSGCSIDSYFRHLRSMEERLGIELLNGGLVFYRPDDRPGEIIAVEHLDFFDRVESGAVRENTIVYDTLISRLGDLRRGLLTRPYKDSWHARTYGRPAAVGA